VSSTSIFLGLCLTASSGIGISPRAKMFVLHSMQYGSINDLTFSSLCLRFRRPASAALADSGEIGRRFRSMEGSWIEQRGYAFHALQQLRDGAQRDSAAALLLKRLDQELDDLVCTQPATDGATQACELYNVAPTH